MDGEFIAPRELILAGVGIGIAVVLLALLSLLQRARLRREGAERLRTLESETGGASDAPPGSIPFFIACYNGANARFFRVYQAPGELLFVNAGQYFALIDVESMRGTDQRHWLLRSIKLVFIGLAAGAVAAAIGVAAIVRGVARKAANNPEGARDILLLVFAVIGFLAVTVVVGVPLMLWQVTRRCRQLDPMSLARLRQEAELDRRSFRATPATVADFKVTLLDQRENFIPSHEIGSTIRFKDSVTGRWKIETKATADTRAAVQALRTTWGSDCVDVAATLRERLGERTAVPETAEARDDASPSLWQRLAPKNTEPRAQTATNRNQPAFLLDMLIGFAVAAVIAVAIAFAMSAAAGRYRYTVLLELVFALGGSGTWLGHVVGCLRHKELGINALGPLPIRVASLGAAIWLFGTIAVCGAVLGIMTALHGPPPH